MESPPHRRPSGSELNLDLLMSRYQQADLTAATELIRHVSPLLYRFLAADGTCRQDIEDMLQEAWLQIHKARHTWRPEEPVLPWLYAITRYVKVDAYRKRQRLRVREQSMDFFPEPVASSVGSVQSLPDFATIVASLPAGQREVVTMLKQTGMTVEEVARATTSTSGAVKLKAHRAYKKLRSILKAGCINKQNGNEA